MAFDSISRLQLWANLESSSIDWELLLPCRALHDSTHLKVRLNRKGNLSEPISTYKGVRQGCLLAPFLFNFYINNIVSYLDSPSLYPPKLQLHVPILLYAVDAVLIATLVQNKEQSV